MLPYFLDSISTVIMEYILRNPELHEPQNTGSDVKSKASTGVESASDPNQNADLSEDHKSIVAAMDKIKADEEMREKYVATLMTELDKDETRKKMADELGRLADTVFGIKQHFESVRSTLYKFDQKKYRKLKPDGTAGGDYIEPLEPKWNDFRAVG